MSERIGYDELLDSRVKQLRLIDERLEKIHTRLPAGDDTYWAVAMVRSLRLEIATMIAHAEAESEAF